MRVPTSLNSNPPLRVTIECPPPSPSLLAPLGSSLSLSLPLSLSFWVCLCLSLSLRILSPSIRTQAHPEGVCSLLAWLGKERDPGSLGHPLVETTFCPSDGGNETRGWSETWSTKKSVREGISFEANGRGRSSLSNGIYCSRGTRRRCRRRFVNGKRVTAGSWRRGTLWCSFRDGMETSLRILRTSKNDERNATRRTLSGTPR